MSLKRAWPLPEELMRYHNNSVAAVRVIKRLPINDPSLVAPFVSITLQDRNQLLEGMLNELASQVSLALLASCEAVLRADFEECVRTRPKATQKLNALFRTIHGKHGDRVRLDDILDAWKSHVGTHPAVFAAFGEFLQLRHWLAHGRRWTPKIARRAEPSDVKKAVDDLFGLLPSDFPMVK